MPEDKIPRVIHYCWFSGEPMPALLKRCMKSWKEVMPDYKLRLWDANSFDFESVPFVQEAFKAKKWAFVADYVRLYALYHEGGIYLDSDVRVFRRFDEFLKYNFFTSHEIHPFNFTATEQAKLNEQHLPQNGEYIYGLNVQAAIIGSINGLPFVKECLDFYDNKHLLNSAGKPLCEEFIIGPYISKIAEKYGYKYNLTEQRLENDMMIFGPEVFVGNSAFLTKDSYASHICNGSWKEKERIDEIKYRIRNQHPEFAPMFALGDRLSRMLKWLLT